MQHFLSPCEHRDDIMLCLECCRGMRMQRSSFEFECCFTAEHDFECNVLMMLLIRKTLRVIQQKQIKLQSEVIITAHYCEE